MTTLPLLAGVFVALAIEALPGIRLPGPAGSGRFRKDGAPPLCAPQEQIRR